MESYEEYNLIFCSNFDLYLGSLVFSISLELDLGNRLQIECRCRKILVRRVEGWLSYLKLKDYNKL